MTYKLHLELFFFNATTDYLPHYRPLMLKQCPASQPLQKVLERCQETMDTFSFPMSPCMLRINGCVVDGVLEVASLVERFGTSWRIEPLSITRAIKDLIINDDDFMEKVTPLIPFCDDEDSAFYRSLYGTYYASSALTYNSHYIGDACLLLAERLLSKPDVDTAAILDIVGDRHHGVWLYEYDVTAFPAIDLRKTSETIKSQCSSSQEGSSLISTFKKLVNPRFEVPQKSPSLQVLSEAYHVDIRHGNELDIICDGLGFERLRQELQHSFQGFHIAFYHGPQNDEKKTAQRTAILADVLDVTVVDFNYGYRACGADIVAFAEEIAFEKAGTIMMDAFDQSADLLVVPSQKALAMFDTKRCSDAVGRELDLQVITLSQLVAIALGTTDKKLLGLNKAPTKISFI